MFSTYPKTNFSFSGTFISSLPNALNLDLPKILLCGKELTTLRKKAFENIMGKGENVGNNPFLLFPQYFLSFPKTNFSIWDTIILSSANAFSLAKSKILSCGKELPNDKI